MQSVSIHSRRLPRPTCTATRGVRIQLKAPVVVHSRATPPFNPGSIPAIHI